MNQPVNSRVKIKKFYEKVEDIDNDKAREIIQEIENISQENTKSKEVVVSLISLLDRYTSDSEESNDQIDETVVELRSIDKKYEKMNASLAKITEFLTSYIDDGRKYLF
jgi:DNA-directed RNA polymerase subunit F